MCYVAAGGTAIELTGGIVSGGDRMPLRDAVSYDARMDRWVPSEAPQLPVGGRCRGGAVAGPGCVFLLGGSECPSGTRSTSCAPRDFVLEHGATVWQGLRQDGVRRDSVAIAGFMS